MTESIYLIQIKEKSRKGRPGGDWDWRIDLGSRPIRRIREAKQKAISLSKEFPHADFRAKVYWELDDE